MDKYLLEILKDSNTIIIPGLGALTITNKDTGETMFMPYLQHDDGKLAAFIAQNDGIDEADAKNMVAKYVREIKAELDKGESYSMFKLGTFQKKDDGDIEFSNWEDTSAKTEETTVVPAPVIEPEVESEPEVENEAEVLPEPEVESEPEVSEPEVQPEAVVESEPEVTSEPEPEVIPEPVAEVEPIVENEPEPVPEEKIESDPEPVVESEPVVENEPETVSEPEPEVVPDPIETPEEEAEIRETIVAAMDSAPEIDEIIPDKTTLEPSPLLDDIAPTAAVALDPEMESDAEGETDGDSEEEEKKKKAGAGFWITIIIIALGIIAGGAYVGRNYNDLKQHIPFLADENAEEDEKKALKDEMSNVIKEDKYSAKTERYDGSYADGEEEFMDEGTNDDGSSETIEVETQPEPEVRTPEVTTPTPAPTPVNISKSSSGPFKVIAGAFSSEANANKLAAQFKAKGMNSEVFLKGELHAVSMQSYPTSEAANAELSKLQSMAPGAWIYYKR